MWHKLAIGVAIVAGSVGMAGSPAVAHEGHASCRSAGQLAASLAQSLGSGFGEQVSSLANGGLADDFVASIHEDLCAGR